jgi:hypothetical protein
MKMTHRIFACTVGLTTTLLCATVQGQITFSSGGSLTAWNGSPVYTSIANSSLSGASTGQGDATITGTYGLMAETFTPSSGFTLGSFDILLGVNNITSSTYQIDLYDLGPAGSVSASSSTATYDPSTSSPSTLKLDFSDTVTFAGSSGGEVQGTFTLATQDQAALAANEEYALEIWTPSADGASGVTWYRNGGSPVDPGGQMFSSADAINNARATLAGNGQAGGAPRIGGLALYAVAVPEPTTMTLAGLALVAGAWSARRRK